MTTILEKRASIAQLQKRLKDAEQLELSKECSSCDKHHKTHNVLLLTNDTEYKRLDRAALIQSCRGNIVVVSKFTDALEELEHKVFSLIIFDADSYHDIPATIIMSRQLREKVILSGVPTIISVLTEKSSAEGYYKRISDFICSKPLSVSALIKMIEKSDKNAQPPKLKILGVEDSVIHQHGMRLSFNNYGHKVVIAENAEKAKKILDKQSFDLVLTDVGLPGESGVEVIKHIRELDAMRHHNTFIAVITANKEMFEADCRRAGANMIMDKPLLTDKTLVLIQRIKAIRDQTDKIKEGG